MTLEKTQTVPLEMWDDGSIRVKGTRLLVDIIISAHKRGDIPEEIAAQFPAAAVAEVYSIVAYYLTHKEEMESYLAGREKEAQEIRSQIESLPGYKEKQEELNQKLLARWQKRKRAR